MAIEDDQGNLHSDQNGKFISKEEQEAKIKNAERIYNSDPPVNSKKPIKQMTPAEKIASVHIDFDKDDFFGEEFQGIKGKDAIEKLLQEKHGYVKDAFERNEIGSIALVWGNKNGGLLHTILKRDRLKEQEKGHISGIEMVKKIPEIIQNGTFNQDVKGRMNIDYEGYRVALKPEYFNHKITWIVSAMEILQ